MSPSAAQLAGSISPIRLIVADLDGLRYGPRHPFERTRNMVATVRGQPRS